MGDDFGLSLDNSWSEKQQIVDLKPLKKTRKKKNEQNNYQQGMVSVDNSGWVKTLEDSIDSIGTSGEKKGFNPLVLYPSGWSLDFNDNHHVNSPHYLPL